MKKNIFPQNVYDLHKPSTKLDEHSTIQNIKDKLPVYKSFKKSKPKSINIILFILGNILVILLFMFCYFFL